LLKKIVTDDPTDIRAQAALGDFYVMLKDVGNASREFNEMKRKAPNVPAGYLKLAMLHASEENWEKAKAELEEGYRANPDSADMIQALVEFYVRRNQLDKALSICSKRLENSPQEIFTHNLLGKIYYAKQDYPQAEKAFQKALDINPEWQEPYNNLAAIYLKQNKTGEAIRKLEKALAANPSNPSAYMTLGALYEEKKESEKAIATYESALKQIPNFWNAANNLAFLLVEHRNDRSDWVRAMSLAQKADRLSPGNPVVSDTIAWIHYKLGETELALKIFESLYDKAPKSGILNYHFGMVLYKTGRLAEAKEKLKIALDTDNGYIGKDEAAKTYQELKARS